MRLGNDALVVNNMTTLLKEQNLKSRLLPMSMPFYLRYLNLEEKDSALIRLKVAEKFTNKRKKQDIDLYSVNFTKS
jgi:hypothetical protein